MLPSNSAITFRTTDPTKWGTGKNAALTKDEIDLNFWELLTYIADLQNNPSQANGIYSIVGSNGVMTITLNDGTTFNIDLPQQTFRWTGAFQASHDYKRFDVLTAADGAYLALHDFTSDTIFDASASDLNGQQYGLMFPYQNIYDISFFAPSKPGSALSAGDTMFALRLARDAFLPADLPGSYAGFDVNPADGPWTVDIYKNTTLIGSYTHDADASSGAGGFFTFTDNVQFNAGDVLRVTAPSSVDSAAKAFSMVLAAKKGTF
jgi:hypothetical protein